MVRKLRLREDVIYNNYSEMKDNEASLELKQLCSEYGYNCDRIPCICIDERNRGVLELGIWPKNRDTAMEISRVNRNQNREVIKYDNLDFSLIKPFYKIQTSAVGDLYPDDYEQFYLKRAINALEFVRKLENFDFSQLPKYYE